MWWEKESSGGDVFWLILGHALDVFGVILRESRYFGVLKQTCGEDKV
jgi:hypothetical protein